MMSPNKEFATWKIDELLQFKNSTQKFNNGKMMELESGNATDRGNSSAIFSIGEDWISRW